MGPGRMAGRRGIGFAAGSRSYKGEGSRWGGDEGSRLEAAPTKGDGSRWGGDDGSRLEGAPTRGDRSRLEAAPTRARVRGWMAGTMEY